MLPNSSPVDFDPLDPPPVVAAALGVAVQTLANWRTSQSNPLPYIKLGRSIRYRRSVWQGMVAAAEKATAEVAA